MKLEVISSQCSTIRRAVFSSNARGEVHLLLASGWA